MTQYEIHYKLAEKIIFPEHRKYSLMCSLCGYKNNCNTLNKTACINQLATFMHDRLLEIMDGEYEILQL